LLTTTAPPVDDEGANPVTTTAFFEVEQVWDGPTIPDVALAVGGATADLTSGLRTGSRVAIACGSRGISRIREVIAAVVSTLRKAGHAPFVVTAMGSHGGATDAGQEELLATYGITEEGVGAPIVARMDVARVGTSPDGVPLFFDKIALSADAVVLVNRVKPHTTLTGDLGSGLMKMLCVGLGNRIGAETMHAWGLQAHLRPVASALLGVTPVVGGIAIVENARGEIAHIEAVSAPQIVDRDRALLALARSYLPKISLDPIDVLVVRRMGKNISGTGMDPNVIGLHRRHGGAPDRTISTIVALDLSEESHGNATGVGMADLVTSRLRDKIDWKTTSTNCLTGKFPAGMRLPFALPSDREALETAFGLYDPASVRALVVDDTLHLSRIWASESLLEQCERTGNMRRTTVPAPLVFNSDGDLSSNVVRSEAM
jgi:hypothetical protein